MANTGALEQFHQARAKAGIGRREFVTLLGGATVAWPLTARAQQAERMRRIGVLMGYAESDPAAQSLMLAFQEALQKLGWTEGRNVQIERRWSAGDADRIKAFARELVELKPDAILAQNTPVVAALHRQTRTVPVVFVVVSDPIGSGLVASLARPGGNFTGFTNVESAMGGKWIELLKEIAPRVDHVALIFNPLTAPPVGFYSSAIDAAVAARAMKRIASPVHNATEIEAVLASQGRTQTGGLIVMPDAFNVTNRDLIISLAARYRVPAIYGARLYAASGGLICYGTDLTEQFRQAANYVDRILKGAKPADLPVQLPTKFQLVINLKTAKALGLDPPLSLLMRVNEVIE